MSAPQSIFISQEILDSTRLTIAELQQELAIWLYAQGRLGIGKARELAGMSLWQFRQLLAAREISPHFTAQDFEEDANTLRDMDRS